MRRASALLLLVTLAAVGRAAPPERTHDITPDDYASVNTITEIAVSPDGKRVAYCLATWDKKADNRRTDLWVVDTDGKGKPVQLTKDRANERLPKWSGDGKSVFVLANRGDKAKPQVWKVPADSGEPVAVTKIEAGVTGYDYAPKADAVFYSVDATTTDEDDFAALRKKFDKPEYGFGKRTVSEVFRVEKDGKPEQVIAEKRYVREFAVTRDGKRIAMVSAFDDTVLKSEGESRVDVWEGGKVVTPPTDVYRAKAASPHAWLEHLAWNPDGTRFAFCAIFDAYPTEVIVGEWIKDAWAVHQMPRKGEIEVRGYGSPLAWALGRANDAAKSPPDVMSLLSDIRGSTGVLLYNPEVRDGFGYQEAGTVFYAVDVASNSQSPVVVRSNLQRFPALEAGLGKKRISLVDPNPHTATWKFPTVEHVTWKALDGVSVGGPLELPHGWKKGDKPLPLVVAIHGGPTTASYNDLRFDPHNGRMYFAAKGYAVLCPNYRGSTGYGDKFVTDLIGKENDIEVKDIIAGIQHLIKEGIADPDRIAVMGWSNGGYLTNCLITLKDSPVKIRAASSGAGIVDTVAEWGFNDEPAYPKVFKKGLPWETPDIYKATSPTYGLGNVKTPTLIHVGGGDERCPPGHSRMLHRALKEYVKVPTELMVYPGEPHGLTKLSNRVAKMEWDLAWFEKYLRK
ncbi:S9 family peptidase [Gemmata sp.]|uniref:S9 family peptidase n=1 Tax=Gemmata sp. TaxID=1914242 RepID=UPI003F71E1FD